MTSTTRRTLYVTGSASWPTPAPARAATQRPCNHLRLHIDGTCAGCRALIYDRRWAIKGAG